MPGNGAAGASYGDLLVTSLIVLGVVCVAAFVVVRLAGRFLATGRTRGAHLLEVVARLSLEPRRSLYVVEVPGRTLLVGTSEMGLSVLSELDRGEVRARMVERPSFGELVRAAWLRRRGPAAVDPVEVDRGDPISYTASMSGARDGTTEPSQGPVLPGRPSASGGSPGPVLPGRASASGDSPVMADRADEARSSDGQQPQ
jgi:flagellar protein FliO/FliZ